MNDEISKPRHGRERQDWVTSFDRDLIRASMARTPISFETIEDETVVTAQRVLQVDREFIKLQIDGEEVWYNKSHLCRVVISST